jgi:hypothetical protein
MLTWAMANLLCSLAADMPANILRQVTSNTNKWRSSSLVQILSFSTTAPTSSISQCRDQTRHALQLPAGRL